MGLSGDPFDLARFIDAQDGVWAHAIAELRAGRKTSHWMWFVFPQIAGLGSSAMARLYAIGSLAEARAYLAHPLLGSRLGEAVAALAAHHLSAEAMLGAVDAVKLRSSLTLFEAAATDRAPFAALLDQLYDGVRDPATLARL